ncbi:MAG: hypothetical protein J2P17_25655, partial [Mycobacterium sp.]|nr:hypothetical protein [Mycobacterium sp.]
MRAAGKEHWLAHERVGLSDFEAANDGFSEQRAAAAKDAATALQELHQVLELRDATPARLREMLWGNDDIDRRLASYEIGRRFVSDDNPLVPDEEIDVKYTQEMLALLLDTDVNGRAVSGDMGCGEGKSLTVMIYSVAKAAELAPQGKAVLVETTRSHLVSRSHTEYVQALREDYGIDVHYRDSADDPVPQPVPGRGSIILMDFNTEVFGYLKGHPSPLAERILDEGDEAVIWSGGGDRVGTVYKISRGAAEPADPVVAKRFNSAAEFLAGNLASGELTPADFGIRDGRDYGVVHLSEDGRATIGRLLGEQDTHNVAVDDVINAAVAEYQYKRDIDYKVYDGYVYLIDRVNGELRHDPETNSDVRITNDIHKALEAKENLVETEAGRPEVPVRHDTESSTEITTQEYINQVRSGDRTTTVSGSNAQSGDLMAKNYDGMGPVVSVEPFHPLDITEHPDVVFDNQDAKLAWIGKQTKVAHEEGQPVLIGCTRDDLCAKQAAVLDGLGVPHRVVGDADYQHRYGASWREQMEADIAKAGEKGEVTIVAPTGARGSDYRVSDEVKELSKAGKMHGIKMFVTGRSGITNAIDVQFARRVGRNGDPGEVIFCLSRDDDAYLRSPDQDVQIAITQFDEAADALADAAAAYQADPSGQYAEAFAAAEHRRDTEADKLLKLIPNIQHNAQQHLS